MDAPALSWIYGSFLAPAMGKGAPRSKRGGQCSCRFSLRPGSGAVRKGNVSPRCLAPLGPHSPGLRYPLLPHVTSCCCFIWGLSQSHSGLTSFPGAGPDFWVLRPHLLIPPFILAAPMRLLSSLCSSSGWTSCCSQPGDSRALGCRIGEVIRWGTGSRSQAKKAGGAVGSLPADLGSKNT